MRKEVSFRSVLRPRAGEYARGGAPKRTPRAKPLANGSGSTPSPVVYIVVVLLVIIVVVAVLGSGGGLFGSGGDGGGGSCTPTLPTEPEFVDMSSAAHDAVLAAMTPRPDDAAAAAVWEIGAAATHAAMASGRLFVPARVDVLTDDGCKAVYIRTPRSGGVEEAVFLLEAHFVAGDARRRHGANSTAITWALDAHAESPEGISAADLRASVRAAAATWNAALANPAASLTEVENAGNADITFTENPVGAGDVGFADIVVADITPRSAFSGAGLQLSETTLAFAITYVFIDDDTGDATDINCNTREDVALCEIYFIAREGGAAWTVDDGAMGDVFHHGTVALHEIGHALGLAHIPVSEADAVMNPIYAGVQTAPLAADLESLDARWGEGAWPNHELLK